MIDKKINDLTFNEKYDAALYLCDSLITEHELNPKYYFYYFGADALKLHSKINHSPLHDRDSVREALVEISISKLDQAIDKLEDIKKTPNNRFYLAGLYGYYSRYAGMNRSWWTAYTNGIKSVGMYEDLIEEFPDCYDAYLYPGVFEYYADRLSGITSFFAGILGVSGDRREGLSKIELAVKKGKIVFPQGSLMMLEINAFMEGNGYESLKYFEAFLEKFPENQRIRNWYVNTMLNLGLAEKASKTFESEYGELLDDFVKAKYYFLLNKNSISLEYSKSAFAKDPPTWRGIIEYTKYLHVYNNWLLGNETEVIEDAPKLNEYYSNKFTLDQNFENESKYIYELRSLAAMNKKEAFLKLVEDAPKFNNKEFEDEFYLIQGVYLFQQERFVEAEPYFIKSKITNNYRNKVNSLGYLLSIYMVIDTTKEKAAQLIDEIEESEYQRLIYRSNDLEKKYRI
ncbi:MAG: hypothetical protein ABFS12_04385 [Bacteroidota bacterium]